MIPWCRSRSTLLLAHLGESAYNPAMLYTPAMIAELVKVPVASVRAWQRRGWLVPSEVEHGLARFDFAQVTVARTLAGLIQAGVKPAGCHRVVSAPSTMPSRPIYGAVSAGNS